VSKTHFRVWVERRRGHHHAKAVTALLEGRGLLCGLRPAGRTIPTAGVESAAAERVSDRRAPAEQYEEKNVGNERPHPATRRLVPVIR
jgi:hypothetical protein